MCVVCVWCGVCVSCVCGLCVCVWCVGVCVCVFVARESFSNLCYLCSAMRPRDRGFGDVVNLVSIIIFVKR